MRLSRSLVLALSLLVGAASAAQAQTSIFDGTYTGGSNFNTTASVSLGYDALGSGVYLFTLGVTNLGDASVNSLTPYNAVFMAVGLFNLPNGFAVSPVGGIGSQTDYSSPDNSSTWNLPPPNDLNGDGLTPKTTAFIVDGDAPHTGLQVGQAITFKFQVSGLQGFDVTTVGAGIHAISGPYGCSTKLGVQGGQVVRSVDGDGVSDACTMSTVPEPASTALLGTGLLALLGFAWIRRKRGLPIVQEHAA